MVVVKRKKQEAVIVARANGSEQVFKVTVAGIQGDNVALEFDVGAGVSVHSAEEWEQAQAERKAAKLTQGANRPKVRAAYSD
jgi:sRNA-binding carbon storage regulator CsrA